MLLMGLVPPLMQIPFDEQISELFGHLWWLWIIEIVRHDLRYRITGYGSVEDERWPHPKTASSADSNELHVQGFSPAHAALFLYHGSVAAVDRQFCF